MSELHPLSTNWLTEENPKILAKPPKLSRWQRFVNKAGQDNVQVLTAVLATAALLQAGSEAKDLAHDWGVQQSTERTACYKKQPTVEFNPDCSNELLSLAQIAAGGVAVFGFFGGTVVAGSLLVSQYRRQENF